MDQRLGLCPLEGGGSWVPI